MTGKFYRVRTREYVQSQHPGPRPNRLHHCLYIWDSTGGRSDPWAGINGSGTVNGTYKGIRVSPDGRFFASADYNHGITVANLRDGVPDDGSIFPVKNAPTWPAAYTMLVAHWTGILRITFTSRRKINCCSGFTLWVSPQLASPAMTGLGRMAVSPSSCRTSALRLQRSQDASQNYRPPY